MLSRFSRNVLAPIAFSAAAQERPTDRLWNETLNQARSCGTAFNETMSTGARCLFGRGLDVALDEGTRLAMHTAPICVTSAGS